MLVKNVVLLKNYDYKNLMYDMSIDVPLCKDIWLLQVVAFNRTVEKVEQFLQNEAKGTKVIGAKSLEDMVSKLKKPRRVMLLVKAGQAVDDFILKLVRTDSN